MNMSERCVHEGVPRTVQVRKLLLGFIPYNSEVAYNKCKLCKSLLIEKGLQPNHMRKIFEQGKLND